MKYPEWLQSGRLVAVIFLGIIVVSGVGTLGNLSLKNSAEEKRKFAELPPIPQDLAAIEAWPGEIDKYINDRFGFRNDLAKLNTRLMVGLFNVSPISKVVAGKDGWLYYADESALSPQPFTGQELELWRHALEVKHAWLAARGIEYIFIVAPEKQTIYPENLPRTVQLPVGESNCDRLVAAAERAGSLRPLSLKADLLQAKKIAPVYYQTDSHWNKLGAFIAHKKIMQILAPVMGTRMGNDFSEVKVQKLPIKGGDLAGMLFLENALSDYEYLPLRAAPGVPLTTSHATINTQNYRAQSFVSVKSNDDLLHDVVVFHDSFFENLRPFFAENFRNSYFLGGGVHQFDLSLIKKYRPRFVVEEIVERSLCRKPYVPAEMRIWYQTEQLRVP